ncbi:MAG: hypothetical protein R3C25_06605 [Hyphomonadaceae bacterium]
MALALSTLSFAAGVAGDLTTMDPPRSGARVVLRIPPELPADTVRAAPLPPLISTASAEAHAPAAIRRRRSADTPARLLAEPVLAPAPVATPVSLPGAEIEAAAVTAQKPRPEPRPAAKPGPLARHDQPKGA